MTAVNQVVTELVAAFRSADVDGVTVFDGQAWDPDRDFLAVGWAGQEQAGISFVSNPADAGMQSVRENITVTCRLGLHQGRWEDAQSIRAALLAAFTTYTATLRTHEGLTDLLMQPATAFAGDIVQRGHEGGAEGTLQFTVECSAHSPI